MIFLILIINLKYFNIKTVEYAMMHFNNNPGRFIYNSDRIADNSDRFIYNPDPFANNSDRFIYDPDLFANNSDGFYRCF